MKCYTLTTFDNPFDPFDEFEEWNQFDKDKGYNSNGLMMRFALVSDQLTEVEKQKELSRAIDEIILYDFRNVYKKFTKEIDEFPYELEKIGRSRLKK